MDVLHIECDRCIARGDACDDCVITVLLGPTADVVNLDSDERATLSALAEHGLVPPLRLIPGARPGQSMSLPGRQHYA